MKKGQSGVSLIALVITIIVVIILAAIAFGTSTSTITRANFSTFENNMGEVRVAFQAAATTLKGTEAQNGTERTDAQVYNYIAKGATTLTDANDRLDTWLSKSQASSLGCTQLSGDVMKKAIGVDLPEMKVNTPDGTGRKVSYFVTNEGIIFIWPPYEFDREYYVNETTKLPSGKDATATSFQVGNVLINVGAYTAAPAAFAKDATPPTNTVYFTDGASASAPLGVEAKALYDSKASGS